MKFCILSNNGHVVELRVSDKNDFSTTRLDLQQKKAVKIRYEEECNNIFALVASPRIDQEKVKFWQRY